MSQFVQTVRGLLAYTIWADRQRTDHINHSAHLWGAVYGILFTLAMEPRVVGLFLRQLLNPGFLS